MDKGKERVRIILGYGNHRAEIKNGDMWPFKVLLLKVWSKPSASAIPRTLLKMQNACCQETLWMKIKHTEKVELNKRGQSKGDGEQKMNFTYFRQLP